MTWSRPGSGSRLWGRRERALARWGRSLAVAVFVLTLGACSSRSPLLDMSADELFAYAEAAYEREEWSDAIRGLDRLLAVHPTYPRSPEARLLLARAHFQREEFLTAIAEYERFMQRHPGRPENPDAALAICHGFRELSPVPQRDQGYTRQAITACQNVARDFAGTDQAAEAWEVQGELQDRLAEKEFLTGRFYFRRNLIDSGLLYFQRVVEQYPESSWAPESLLYMVRSYERIGYDEEAEEVKEQLLTRYPESVAAREITGNGE